MSIANPQPPANDSGPRHSAPSKGSAWQPYAKAIVGFLIATLGALATAAPGGLSLGEVLSAVVAGLVTLSAVFVTPNQTSTPGPDEVG